MMIKKIVALVMCVFVITMVNSVFGAGGGTCSDSNSCSTCIGEEGCGWNFVDESCCEVGKDCTFYSRSCLSSPAKPDIGHSWNEVFLMNNLLPVQGKYTPDNYGILGYRLATTYSGVYGFGETVGVWGKSTSGYGVAGASTNSYGVVGSSIYSLGNLIVAGDVGIGTISPDAKLDIEKLAPTLRFTDTDTAIANEQALGSIEFYTSDSSGEGTGANAKIVSYADDKYGRMGLQFHTGDDSTIVANQVSEKMRIDYQGNVGIGTANPNAKLHVMTTVGDSTLIIGDPENAEAKDTHDGNLVLYGWHEGVRSTGRIEQGSSNMFISANDGDGTVMFQSDISVISGKQIKVQNSDNTKRVYLKHDGTDGILYSDSGNMIIQSTGGNVGIKLS